MSTKPVEELYFEWLYSQVASLRTRDKTRTYLSMLRMMHNREFVWVVQRDDNRIGDALYTRQEFIREYTEEDLDSLWGTLGCSFLEMLIALCHRLEFSTDISVKDWFWKLVENMDLAVARDSNFDEKMERHVEKAIERVIFRTYSPKGKGGLFPLKYPKEDQREVEIWYQMQAYMIENDL